MSNPIADGVWPTMLTPFHENKIDLGSLQELVEWYIRNGVNGLFAVCQSSEMFFLSLEERAALARKVVQYACGRVPVIASAIFVDQIDDHIDEIKQLADTGIEGCVLITNRYQDESDPGDDRFKRTVERILREVPDIAFGLYECPYPYKRLVTPELLRWCADSGRFLFLKDTCCDLSQIKAKIDAVKGTKLKIYNANSATLLESLKLGAAGFSGVMANFHPDLYAWLMANWRNEREKAERLQHFLGIASMIEWQCYPVNAKYYLQLEGLGLSTQSRVRSDKDFGATDQLLVKQLKAMSDQFRKEFCLARV